MKNFGGWQVIEPKLGSGGQGTVYRARSPQRTAAIANARSLLRDAMFRLPNSRQIHPPPNEEIELDNLISSVTNLCRADDIATELGALKEFDIPSDGSTEAQAAVHRFEREVEALRSIQHPGILKLLDSNINERWLVTEYHPDGTLDDARSLSRYKGDPLSALRAFHSIVEAVAELHKKGYVHRDIKSNNVFVASDGRLVLGDLGVVFFDDPQRTRLTDEYEKVGTRDWMAPWAHVGVRVDDVRATFDVFPLGKLLWTMVSGRRILPPYYTHRSPGFKLEEVFAGRPGIEQVNSILDKCIVLNEQDCLQDASRLREIVAEAMDSLQQKTPLDQLILTTPDGTFRVQITVSPFQLNVTPLRRNQKGEWVPDESAQGPLGRWQLQPNGGFIRTG
jgi:serine/threonine protein kinase